MSRSTQRRLHRSFWVPIATGILVACSVDTSNITFQKDDVFDRYGDVTDGGDGDTGGAQNQAGVLNKGGKSGSGSGGASTGGSKLTGGNANGGTPAGGSANLAGMGGMGGMGGMPPATGYPCQSRVKPDKLIADFNGLNSPTDPWKDSTMQVMYGLYNYPPGNALALKVGNGTLTGEAHQINQPMGFGIWFSTCVEAKSAGFNALAFRIYATGLNGVPLVMRVGVGSNDNKNADPMNQVGGCVIPMGADPGYCRPPVTEVMITATMPPGQQLAIPFAQMKDGSPAAMVDPTQIAFVEWGFIHMNGQAAYDATVVIDDVYFQ